MPAGARRFLSAHRDRRGNAMSAKRDSKPVLSVRGTIDSVWLDGWRTDMLQVRVPSSSSLGDLPKGTKVHITFETNPAPTPLRKRVRP